MGGPMIESTIVISLLLVAALWFAARLAKENARRDPGVQQARMQASLAWHEERLQRAREQNWDREMIHQISEQVEDARFQLAQVAARQAK